MGLGAWGKESKLIRTKFGLPEQSERPCVADVSQFSITLYFFTPNPVISMFLFPFLALY